MHDAAMARISLLITAAPLHISDIACLQVYPWLLNAPALDSVCQMCFQGMNIC